MEIGERWIEIEGGGGRWRQRGGGAWIGQHFMYLQIGRENFIHIININPTHFAGKSSFGRWGGKGLG